MSKENVDLKSKVDVLEKKLKNHLKHLKKEASNNSFKKIINESKELSKTIKKNNELKIDEDDELIKKLNARAEYNRKINEKLKEYNTKEAQRVSEGVEKFNKMINDKLDMSNEKSEIINRLIELYSLRQIYYLNKIDNNLKANEKIDDVSIDHELNELEKKLRDQLKKGSGMFTSQKKFAKLLTFF